MWTYYISIHYYLTIKLLHPFSKSDTMVRWKKTKSPFQLPIISFFLFSFTTYRSMFFAFHLCLMPDFVVVQYLNGQAIKKLSEHLLWFKILREGLLARILNFMLFLIYLIIYLDLTKSKIIFTNLNIFLIFPIKRVNKVFSP